MSSSSTSRGSVPGPATGARTLIDVTMPQMGVSVAEGTVVAWRVEVGDRIEAEQTICEISTDKIDTELPAPASGVVTEILVPVETTVAVGEVLARIAADGGDGAERSGRARASSGRARAPSDAPRPAPEAAPAVSGRGAPESRAERPVVTNGASAAPLLPRRAADRHRAWRRPRSSTRHRARRAGPQAGRPGFHRVRRGVSPGGGAGASHREPLST